MEAPAQHVIVEFSFDVVQAAGGKVPAGRYRQFIGFRVATPALERAFRDVYGLDLGDVLSNQDRAVGTFRYAVSQLVPALTEAAWRDKHDEIEKLTPGVERSRFVFTYNRSDYEREYGRDYRSPDGLRARRDRLSHRTRDRSAETAVVQSADRRDRCAVRRQCSSSQRALSFRAEQYCGGPRRLSQCRFRYTGDRVFAELARKSGKPIVLSPTRAKEGGRRPAGSFRAGLGEPSASAEHGEGMSDLYDALRAALAGRDGIPDGTSGWAAAEAQPGAVPHAIRVAVVGRPNSGKSTLINRLLGEERLLTGPEAGITRDSIAVDLEWSGKRFRLYDTAGLRRRSRSRRSSRSFRSPTRSTPSASPKWWCCSWTREAVRGPGPAIADLVEREGRALVLGTTSGTW